MGNIPCNIENIHYSMEKIHLLLSVSIIDNCNLINSIVINTTIIDNLCLMLLKIKYVNTNINTWW